MQTKLNPYLSFRDTAREAMEFYQTIFGGKLEFHTFEEFHASSDPSENNKIMHAVLESKEDIVFMAADTPNSMDYHPGANISMSLSGKDDAQLRGYYEKLSEGGTVTMPLEKAAWGDSFGMCIDKFGISWMVNIGAQ